MPPTAIDGAIKFAVSKRRTGIISKLQEIKIDKLEGRADAESMSGDEVENGGVEEALDLEDTPQPTPSQMADENAIKPKAFKLGRSGDAGNPLDCLDSKRNNLVTCVSRAKKRSNESDDEPDIKADSRPSSSNSRNCDDEEEDEKEEDEEQEGAFHIFFSALRQDIEEDNPDAPEKELTRLARCQFNQLDDDIRAKWVKKYVSRKNKSKRLKA